MNKRSINYWVGIALLISILSFFFYKSIFNEAPLNETLSTIKEMHDFQVRLHRDLLRYRSNQIKQYDTLNKTLYQLELKVLNLSSNEVAEKELGIDAINAIEKAIIHQSALVEDFKTHHSILQNSLFYIFNESTELYSTKPKTRSKQELRTTAELLTLLLEYNDNPHNNIANKIYPLIDSLNHNPNADTNALINHSLMIIERLPEIDNILAQFNSLDIENQIILLRNKVSDLRNQQNYNAQIFNILLFICTIYLILYILYIFITLRKNEEKLSDSNAKLNEEISHRSRTEKALYQLVDIDKNSKNNDDRILHLLNALCKALDAEYAYITRTSSTGVCAEIIGILDHGMFSSNITYPLKNTPCEEVINNGRLVHNRDFSTYFPDYGDGVLKGASSYIGISLTDKNKNVIGMIAIASKKPIGDTSLAENILTIATSRAIIELEYQIEINNNIRYQQGLSLIDNWIARLITEGYDRNAFFKNICRAAQEITKADLAAFPALQKNQKSYNFLAACGSQSEKLEDIIRDVADGDLCSWTILHNKNLVIDDIATDKRAQKKLIAQFDIKSALLTPVTLKDQAYGAIAVFRTHDAFDKIDEQLITQFSQSVQMAIINMQLVSDMKSERERAEVTLHSIGDAVITTNANGEIEYMNHVAESLTEWTLEQAKNGAIQHVFRIEDQDTGDAIHDVVNSCLYDGITISKSIVSLIGKNGNKKDIESSISPILKTSGQIEGVIIVFHDETQRRQLENTIKHQAAHDPLTNLLNRDAFEINLSDSVFDAKNNEKHHVLCYLNLDRFKLINDTAGYSAGDQCLLQVSSLLQTCIRNDDVLARLGADEFAIILKNCSSEGALKIAENITTTISNTKFHWDDCDYNLGICIGINPLSKNAKDAADAIRKADLACYTAKDQGENKIYFYKEKDSELIQRQEKTYWASHITEAIDNNRLRLYTQPIVALNSPDTHTRHFEILVRLLDENDQLIMPSAFIPAAERYNLMPLVDRKIILETFSFIHQYSDEDEYITHYSLNLSGNTIDDNKIVDYILETANKFEIDKKLICFEITETATIKNMDKAKALIKELKACGFKFSLDDFGTGLSSFQYLKNLPVDFLKIDGSFVSNMVNNKIDHAMVAAINEVAHIMGIKTIAEYVENEQIIKKLREINVDFGQGYFIEQPKPINMILASSGEIKSPTLKVVNHEPRRT